MVNLSFPFSIFITQSTIAFVSLSSADASNAVLTCSVTSLRTRRNCSCDYPFHYPVHVQNPHKFPLEKIFLLKLSKSLIDCVRSKNQYLCVSLQASMYIL